MTAVAVGFGLMAALTGGTYGEAIFGAVAVVVALAVTVAVAVVVAVTEADEALDATISGELAVADPAGATAVAEDVAAGPCAASIAGCGV